MCPREIMRMTRAEVLGRMTPEIIRLLYSLSKKKCRMTAVTTWMSRKIPPTTPRASHISSRLSRISFFSTGFTSFHHKIPDGVP